MPLHQPSRTSPFEHAARLFAGLLVVVHAGLALWASVGLLELVLPQVPWQPLSNPLFSPPLLLLQWTLIGSAAFVFLFGYFRRWRLAPHLLAGIYAMMALVCAYQTFFVLTAPSRYRAMVIEYVEYLVILVFLFRSRHMRRHFALE